MIEYILKQVLQWKEEEGYEGDLLRLCYNNNLWNSECVGLALMLALDYKYCMSEITILNCINKHIENQDGSKICNFSNEEKKLIKLIIESNIYEKYNK